jgi:protein arginine phosphatase
MVWVGADLGVDLGHHRSRSITDVDEPDLVLCMEQDHVLAARRTFPNLSSDAIRLLDNSGIADPFGSDLDTYRACGAQIAQAINNLQI